MISSKKYVDETLRKYGLVANKALGQNFLIEDVIAQEIVEKAGINEQTIVIEIGPGMGALTEFLLQKAKFVYAYEIDANMVHILQETFQDVPNFVLTNIDFMKVNLKELLDSFIKQGYHDIKLISNLPYYITSKLLNKILVNNYPLNTMVAMMQKEVGSKLLKPDQKDLNVLTTILDYQYQVSVVKYVGKNSYLPRPEIDSIVLKFEKVDPQYEVDFEILIEVIQALFTNRRKTIYNNLKPLFDNVEEVNTCLTTLALDAKLRVEQIGIQEIVSICRYIKKKHS